jgi:hypothetical protein
MENFGTIEYVQIVLVGVYCIALWFYLDRAI